MDIDFKEFFERYETISAFADKMFQDIKKEYPDCVTCKITCSDCCHALFDLTLIEALYINDKFNKMIPSGKRNQLMEKSNRADRKIYKLKRKAYQDHRDGKNEVEVLMEMSAERVRCPLLNDDEMCDLYEFRPITCRLYGIPTSCNGLSHICGKTGFVEGQNYPSVYMDKIHQKLYEISSDLIKSIKTKYSKMADMLVPLSMVLLTDYNEEYLGISNKETEKKFQEKKS
jgi:Fe-S-cluster containining protein